MELSSLNLSSLPSAFRSIDGLRMHSTTAPVTITADVHAPREQRGRRRKGRSRTIEDLLVLNPNLDSLVSNEEDDDEVGVMMHDGEDGSGKHDYSYYHDDMMFNNSRHSIDRDTSYQHHHQHHHRAASDISISNKRPFEEEDDPMVTTTGFSTYLEDREPIDEGYPDEESDDKSCGSSDGGGHHHRITGRHLRIASITTDVSGLSYDHGYLDHSCTPPRPVSYMMASHHHHHQQPHYHHHQQQHYHHHQYPSQPGSHLFNNHPHQPTSNHQPHHQTHLQPHGYYSHHHPSISSASAYAQHLTPISDDSNGIFTPITRGISFMSIFSNKKSSDHQ